MKVERSVKIVPTEDDAREWCARRGFEFRSWDGTLVCYRDPKFPNHPLEYGMESWVLD